MNEQESRAFSFFLKNGFIKADKESFPVFRKYESCSVLEEMSATIVAAWSFAYNGLYKLIHGWLCSVYFYEGKPVYFAIHRPLSLSEYSLQRIVDILYDLCMEAGLPFLQVKFIEERRLCEFEAIKGYEIKTEFFDSDTEYAYRPSDFLNLSGNVNMSKRHRIKKCSLIEKMTLFPVTNDNIHLCSVIQTEWCGAKECSFCESFSGCEKEALNIMMDIFDDRIYNGLYLYYENKAIGYAIGERRDQNISFLYFGKTTIQNYFVYLIYKMVELYFSDAVYFNMSEDMGNAGLRLFKTHLGKYIAWRKYICTFIKKRL
ncbi:MAG: hypothetical protein LBK73_02645 [Treponema sp.]|nr:hypothetical protein [Treponema sp.]